MTGSIVCITSTVVKIEPCPQKFGACNMCPTQDKSSLYWPNYIINLNIELTFAFPRPKVMTHDRIWKSANTKIKKCSWFTPSWDKREIFPWKNVNNSPSDPWQNKNIESDVFFQLIVIPLTCSWHLGSSVISLEIVVFLHGRKLSPMLFGIQIFEMDSPIMVRKSDTNPKSISSSMRRNKENAKPINILTWNELKSCYCLKNFYPYSYIPLLPSIILWWAWLRDFLFRLLRNWYNRQHVRNNHKPTIYVTWWGGARCLLELKKFCCSYL